MDGRQMTTTAGRCRRHVLLWLIAVALAVTQPGCSLFVMAGKMLWGDPKLPSAFWNATGVDLAESGDRVVVIARVPNYLSEERPNLELDLVLGVLDRLRQQGIQTVHVGKLVDWIDDRGTSDGVQAAADHFDVVYVIRIDLEQFSNSEDKSPLMLRGRATGGIYAHKVERVGEQRVERRVFERGFRTRHPRHQPVELGDVTKSVFVQRHLDEVCATLARFFHDHPPGAGI